MTTNDRFLLTHREIEMKWDKTDWIELITMNATLSRAMWSDGVCVKSASIYWTIDVCFFSHSFETDRIDLYLFLYRRLCVTLSSNRFHLLLTFGADRTAKFQFNDVDIGVLESISFSVIYDLSHFTFESCQWSTLSLMRWFCVSICFVRRIRYMKCWRCTFCQMCQIKITFLWLFTQSFRSNWSAANAHDDDEFSYQFSCQEKGQKYTAKRQQQEKVKDEK